MSSLKVVWPARITQETNETCWAAALKSWLRSTGGPNYTQRQLSEAAKDGVTVKDFVRNAASFNMVTEYVTYVGFVPDRIQSFLAERKLPLFVGGVVPTDEPTTWWHCYVLFGIEGEGENARYNVMDPADGTYRVVKDIEFFKRPGFPEAVVGRRR